MTGGKSEEISREGIKRRPVHEQVAGVLRVAISTRYEPGERLPSEAALAKSLEVSVHTVREALSVLASEGLVVRRHGSGTYRGEPTPERHVAVFCELDLSHPRAPYFFLRVVQESYLLLSDRGVPVKLYVGHCPPGRDLEAPSCPEFVEAVREDRIGALLAVGVELNRLWYDPLKARGVPIVGLPGEHNIDLDWGGMIDEAVRRIGDAGRERVGMIGPSPDIFRESMARHGLGVREGWIGHKVHPLQRGAGQSEFHRIWEAEEEKPNAVFFTDDVLFQDAALAVLSLGIRVPEELLVVTHMNRGARPALPFPFQALEFDPDEFARLGAELVIRLWGAEDVSKETVTCRFRFREVRPQQAGALAGARSLE
jgi:DNA-binding LacI/PurR family transcriptional regulator